MTQLSPDQFLILELAPEDCFEVGVDECNVVATKGSIHGVYISTNQPTTIQTLPTEAPSDTSEESANKSEHGFCGKGKLFGAKLPLEAMSYSMVVITFNPTTIFRLQRVNSYRNNFPTYSRNL